MNPDEFFLPGKMYVYGGIPHSIYEFYRKTTKVEPRKWLRIEGVTGEKGKHYPKIGDYYMCLEVTPREMLKNSNWETISMSVIKFLTPDGRVVFDSCRKVTLNTVEKWKPVC